MSLFDRIGMDVGRRLPVEEAIRWAAANAVGFLDVQTDLDPNAWPGCLTARLRSATFVRKRA